MNRARALLVLQCAMLVAIVGLIALYLPLVWNDVERRKESIQVDGTTREYLLIVRKSVGNEPVPLVIALHGTGDSPQSMSSYSGLDRLVSEKGLILVYPNAVGGMWKVMEPDLGDDNRDIRFVDALLDRLSSQFRIDARRIYVVGMSNGASFAMLLGDHRSRQIAAVVAHSGTAPSNTPMPERAVPVMLVVGADDTPATVEAMREAAKDYERRGRPVELNVVDHLGHEWAKNRNSEIWEFLKQHPLDK